ncbi:MAG TPA: ABC-2 transporter permease, partial [Bacillota bacterium]|nr:ABC-2 transporter permease [Bacillota bacterium]
MKGLLIKDFLILKNQGKLLALALLVYSIIAFSSGNADMVTTMLFVVSVIMPVTAIAYDEK